MQVKEILGCGGGKALADSPQYRRIFRLLRQAFCGIIPTMAKENQNLAGITGFRNAENCALSDPSPDWKPLSALLLRLLWAAALVFFGFRAPAAVVFTTLHPFGGTNDGAQPYAALVQGSDGYFYGTTISGGAHDAGTVFQISSNGTLTTLYSFHGSDDGGYPTAALVQGRDGSFYGTTTGEGDTTNPTDPWGYGGPGWGTVFKISANDALTTLYAFTGLDDGGIPNGLIQGSDGYFYGTTGSGTFFQISSNGTFTTLGYLDGNPDAGVAQGSDGYFYGTTINGGTSETVGDPGNPGYGTVFKIATNGLLTTLYSFTGGKDGGNPTSALVQGGDGSFYGTTAYGGITNVTFSDGSGAVFKIRTNGSLTTLHLFTGGKDGGSPSGALVQGGDGSFYGTTQYGGIITPTNRLGNGTVFKINTDGSLTTVYSFTGLNVGDSPNGLIVGSDGSFYGTTQYGGAGGGEAGTVFRLTIVPEPPLSIIPFGAEVIMSWPTNYAGFDFTGYSLQSTANLSSAVWTNVSPNPVVIGGQNVVVSPITGTQQFFRLSQ